MNHAVLKLLNPEQVEVEICLSEELDQRRGLTSELDEMWSYVHDKGNPRWLWHAIDHRSGTILAYVFGRRQDTVFLELKALLEPFGMTWYYPDGWGAYYCNETSNKLSFYKELQGRENRFATSLSTGNPRVYVNLFDQRATKSRCSTMSGILTPKRIGLEKIARRKSKVNPSMTLLVNSWRSTLQRSRRLDSREINY